MSLCGAARTTVEIAEESSDMFLPLNAVDGCLLGMEVYSKVRRFER